MAIDRLYLHGLLGKQYIHRMHELARRPFTLETPGDVIGLTAEIVRQAMILSHPDATAEEIDVTPAIEKLGHTAPHGVELHVLKAPPFLDVCPGGDGDDEPAHEPGEECDNTRPYEYVAYTACGCGDLDDENFATVEIREAIVQYLAAHPDIAIITEQLALHPDTLDQQFSTSVGDMAPIQTEEQRQAFIDDLEKMLGGSP